jgi:hypothetical protein
VSRIAGLPKRLLPSDIDGPVFGCKAGLLFSAALKKHDLLPPHAYLLDAIREIKIMVFRCAFLLPLLVRSPAVGVTEDGIGLGSGIFRFTLPAAVADQGGSS